jgi:hypothetical protein
MNNQNILKYKGTKLDGILDHSELYDFQLINDTISVLLDNSEFFDYKLGDILIDFIYYEDFAENGPYIVSQDDYILQTHDNYLIEYK